MSDKAANEKLDKVIKRLDILTVISLARSGLSRKDIAGALKVSEKTIERLISVAKIKKVTGVKVLTPKQAVDILQLNNLSRTLKNEEEKEKLIKLIKLIS